jgi:hypothetical protein
MDERTILSFTTVVDGHAAEFRFMKRTAPHWISDRYSRNGGHMSCTSADYHKKPRVYVSTAGESLLENLANRSTRPSVLWGKLVRAALKQADQPGKLGWSQHAGCGMCPCSPGFIWTGAPFVKSTDGHVIDTYDVWVTLGDVPRSLDDPESISLQNFRAAQVMADPTLAPFADARL